MDNTQNYISENKERFLDELLDLLRIPSISADATYSADVHKTAEHIAESLTKAGAENVARELSYPAMVVDQTMIDRRVKKHFDRYTPMLARFRQGSCHPHFAAH